MSRTTDIQTVTDRLLREKTGKTPTGKTWAASPWQNGGKTSASVKVDGKDIPSVENARSKFGSKPGTFEDYYFGEYLSLF